MSIDSNYMNIQETYETNDSVFSSAFPYAAGTLALAGGGTYLCVTANAAGATALAVGGVALALFGAYGFFTTAMVGIYSKNSAEFREKIGPALKASAALVFSEMIASVAKTVFYKILDDAIGGRGRRN